MENDRSESKAKPRPLTLHLTAEERQTLTDARNAEGLERMGLGPWIIRAAMKEADAVLTDDANVHLIDLVNLMHTQHKELMERVRELFAACDPHTDHLNPPY